MLEYNWSRPLNKCMYAVTIYFFTFPISKGLYIFLKKKRRSRLFTCQRLAADHDAMILGLGLVKNLLFSYKRADFSVIVNISVKTLWCHAIDTIFAFFYVFHFFQIVMVSLFFVWHNQCFIMFKDSKFFQFTNFPLKTKYNNTVVHCDNSNYLLSIGKQEKKLFKQFFD